MALPFFYHPDYTAGQTTLVPDENTGKHIVQVLRMQNGDKVNITNGRGHLVLCEIIYAGKKKCELKVISFLYQEPSAKKITIAISLLKNSNRFEWFLEKATEIGVSEIIPLQCKRTEKEKFRYDRMNQICISAMLQSQQCWLPLLREPVLYEKIETWKCTEGKNFIAHCIDTQKQTLMDFSSAENTTSLVCIGPEGDFTEQEIELALANHFIPVTLGNTRLRTETAGVVAATLLKMSS